jgi:hypothetical protein
MDLFKQAEREYFSRKEQQLDAEECEQQLDIEACKHQLIIISGVMTCNSCGLETYPVFVPGMGRIVGKQWKSHYPRPVFPDYPPRSTGTYFTKSF